MLIPPWIKSKYESEKSRLAMPLVRIKDTEETVGKYIGWKWRSRFIWIGNLKQKPEYAILQFPNGEIVYVLEKFIEEIPVEEIDV